MTVGRLHVITDTRLGRDPLAVVDVALSAGTPVVQLRAKGLTDRDLYALASEMASRCAVHGAILIVNDRLDVALGVGAAGVHLGLDDLPVPAARRLLGPGHELGATARDPETARRLEAAGATYLGVGPAYATRTKGGLPAPLGPHGIARIAAAVSIPVIAVAGITAARVPEVLAAGAHGVAVISAVSDAGDPGAATRELLAALRPAEARA